MSNENPGVGIAMSKNEERQGFRASSRRYGGLSTEEQLSGSCVLRGGNGLFRDDQGGTNIGSDEDNMERFPDEYSDDPSSCDGIAESSSRSAKEVFNNFCRMSILFSIVPASALACLALASAELGGLGMIQSGTLYLFYTLSAVTFAIHVVKELGSRNALVLGMGLFCVYIGCFMTAIIIPQSDKVFALTGATVGGIGAGILWTSGKYTFMKSRMKRQVLYLCACSSCTLFFFFRQGQHTLPRQRRSMLFCQI